MSTTETILNGLRDTLRSEVTSLLAEHGQDQDGDPILQVWAILPDEPATRWEHAHLRTLRHTIRETLREAGFEPWVQVYFRSEQEQRDVEAGTLK